MISSAIWNLKKSTSTIFKDQKSALAVGRVHFVVFETFTIAYLFQIAREKSCDQLINLFKFIIIESFQFVHRLSRYRYEERNFLLQVFFYYYS